MAEVLFHPFLQESYVLHCAYQGHGSIPLTADTYQWTGVSQTSFCNLLRYRHSCAQTQSSRRGRILEHQVKPRNGTGIFVFSLGSMMHQDKRHKPTPPAHSMHSQPSIDTSEWPTIPVFTAVRLVCRECLHASGDDGLLQLIDSFLDKLSGSLTMSVAYKNSNGSLRLLQYLAVHEPKTMDPFLRRWGGNAVTGEMAARGDLVSIKWVAEKYLPDEFLTESVAQASSHGHLTILKWLWENHREMTYWGGIELYGAMQNNHYDVVDWLRTHITLRPECAQHVIKQAAISGNLEIVKWLYNTFDIEMVDSLNAAAINCHWDIMSWLISNGKRSELDAALRGGNIYRYPAAHGELAMLKFLFDRGLVQEPVHVILMASAYGQLHIIKWLIEEIGIPIPDNGWAEDGATVAARGGHLDVLMYLYQKSSHLSIPCSALNATARSGHLEVVQWLHSNTRAQCTHRAMDDAAGQGHLEMVQWLHENRTEGCSPAAMHHAAVNGHLEVVKWLHINRSEGCSVSTMARAAENGNLGMVQWLHAYRHEQFVLDGVMDTAAAHGHLDILQWFHENRNGGCTTSAMDFAAGNGHLNVVKWLHEHRMEGCSQRAMDDAAINGHLEVVKWLRLHRREGCSTMAIDGAAGNSHLKVVTWLCLNRSQRCTPLALEWLFSKSRRLDTAVFLFSEFPQCRPFHLGPDFEVAWLKVVQWILGRAPSALEGCTLKVKSWNWHVCDWLAQNHWKQTDKDQVFSYWNRM